MNHLLRFLIVLLPIVVLIFFAKILLIDEEIQLSNYDLKNFPEFQLNDLNGNPVQSDSLKGIKVLNVWASWCITCRVEHPYLMYLNKQGIPILGLNYKDEKEDAINWLKKYGDPYKDNIHDYKGSLALDLGVTGAPETFLIINGQVVAHYQGEVNETIWNDVFLPIIDEKRIF